MRHVHLYHVTVLPPNTAPRGVPPNLRLCELKIIIDLDVQSPNFPTKETKNEAFNM